MKNKILVSFTICLMLVSLFALPLEASAQTIAQFESEVEKYTAQLQEKKNKLAKNDQEVAEIKAKISSIESQIAQAEKEIKELQEEIDRSNKEIEKKSEESKKIIEYYQISNGNNAYLEYAFGATDITDMVYRMSIVEQLTDYNDKVMKELEELIKKNEQQQKDLQQKQKDLEVLKEDLEKEKERINADSASIKETMPGIEEQIKQAKNNLSYYKALGCGKNEEITACQYRIEQSRGGGSSGGGSVPSTNGFYRPIEYGYITQWYGGIGGHMGVDVSSSNKTIAIYPIATGQIFFKGYDTYGALVIKIRHNVNGRYIYSTYAHMSRFGAVSVGQNVTPFTQIGNMGSTGYSTGPHLHLELTTCDWNRGGGCTWAQYQRSTINPTSYVNFPSSWNNR